MSLESRLHRRIEQRAGEYLEWLRALVQCPSPSGQEQACQQLVFQRMHELGLRPQRVYASNDGPFHPTGREYSDRPSLVGHLAGTGRRRILLNAHVDTAPVEDEASWIHPPHAAVLEGGKLYGRGSLDDKAGIAMMMLLAETFQEVERSASLYFASVIEDEDSGNGTLACSQAGYWCDQAIILDGTWPFRAMDSHLGQLWLHADIHGQAAASCSCARAINPIDLAMTRVQKLRDWVDQQNQAIPSWLEVQNPFFLSVGEFHSGTWAGAIPERARLSLQLGFPPPYTPEQVVEVAEEILGPVRVGYLCTPPHSQRPNRMAQLLQANVTRLRPGEMEFRIQAVSGHCDLRNLRREDGGLAEACLYGPGGGANPHVANEYYLVDNFIPVAQNAASSLLQLMQS
ncbi:M20/M25/M40 family metallo-hydrolase [bacterium]|nr:M20/M25/M40 family metallo-hydrolase [bacterium]